MNYFKAVLTNHLKHLMTDDAAELEQQEHHTEKRNTNNSCKSKHFTLVSTCRAQQVQLANLPTLVSTQVNLQPHHMDH